MVDTRTLAEKIAAAKAGTAAVTEPAPITVVQPAGQGAGSIAGAQPAQAGSLLAAAIAKSGAVAGVAGAAAGPVGGGNRLALVRDALKTASVKSGRNDIPIGTGVFLLKSGKLFITDGNLNISTFSMLCLQGVRDDAGSVFGADGYSGPVPGESYDVSMFQSFEPKRLASTMANNFRALAACMGWFEKQVKAFQATDQGMDVALELLKGMMCLDMVTSTPTQAPCLFSNQVVIQMTRRAKIVEQKGDNKQPLYDEHGQKATKTYINTFWDKKIPLTDLPPMIGEPATIEAFGTAEAYLAAVENEIAMKALA